MSLVQKRFEQILSAVDFLCSKSIDQVTEFLYENIKPAILVVTKNQPVAVIDQLIDFGHRLFGENRVQEAVEKWSDKKGCNLHLIGPLQTNKVNEALKLFDVIETLDREKLALKIADEQTKLGLQREFYVQVNIGREQQKSGVEMERLEEFVKFCKNDLQLKVTGLMCIPPRGEKPFPYFMRLKSLSKKCGLKNLSMGMSSDYVEAIECGSTQIRIGSAIFKP